MLHAFRKVLAGNKLSEELGNSLIEESNTTHISGQCRIATDCHQPKSYGSLIERLSDWDLDIVFGKTNLYQCMLENKIIKMK